MLTFIFDTNVSTSNHNLFEKLQFEEINSKYKPFIYTGYYATEQQNIDILNQINDVIHIKIFFVN